MERMVARRVEEVIASLLGEEQVLALQGPRAVGKTTLLRAVAASAGVPIVDLDDLATRSAVSADPGLFAAGEPPVCIDEFQKVPDILDAIKAELNVDGSAGRFVITGSTRHDALPLAAQSLTGRLHTVMVYPLSQGELSGVRENYIERLLADPDGTVTSAAVSTTTRADYVARVAAGGFPLAVERSEAARRRWFDAYVAASLDRDVRDLASVRRRDALPRLLNRLAGQTAQVLDISKAGASVGLPPATANVYTKLLEAVFLVHRLPAWGKTLRSRAVASPKLHVVDSGLAARLLRLTPRRLESKDPTALEQFGHLLETFAVWEVLKQVSWLDGAVDAGHYRTRDGAEADLVLETDDGGVTAFEVKAAGRVVKKDFSGLRALQAALGARFKAGVVLYTGGRAYSYQERMHVQPLDRLWSAVP